MTVARLLHMYRLILLDNVSPFRCPFLLADAKPLALILVDLLSSCLSAQPCFSEQCQKQRDCFWLFFFFFPQFSHRHSADVKVFVRGAQLKS